MFSTAILLFAGGSIFSPIGYYVVFLAALIASGLLSICVHEFGHAAAVWMVGSTLYSFRIGVGPLIRRFRLATFDIEIRGHLYGGGAIEQYHYPGRPEKWRTVTVLAGGPGANFIAGLLLFATVSAGADLLAPAFLLTIGMAAAISQFLCGASNLWPRTLKMGGERHPSDGKQILTVLWSKTFATNAHLVGIYRHAAALCRADRHVEAISHCAANWMTHPNGGALFGMLVHSIGRSEGPVPAVRLYLQHAETLEAEPPGGEAAWAYAYGNVAWHALMAEDAEWLPLADRLSARAVAATPLQPEIRATRGAALMALGAYDEGSELVCSGLREIDDSIDKAEFCGFMSRAARSRGDVVLAGEFDGLERHLRDTEVTRSAWDGHL